MKILIFPPERHPVIYIPEKNDKLSGTYLFVLKHKTFKDVEVNVIAFLVLFLTS